MRWLRLVGSLKLQVSFAKEPYKRDDILQKRPIFLRSLLTIATPYPSHVSYVSVLSHVSMSHVTHINESRPTYMIHGIYTWVTSHLPEVASRVTNGNESCPTCSWVMSHTCLDTVETEGDIVVASHVTHINESRPTYSWVMSHTCQNAVETEGDVIVA